MGRENRIQFYPDAELAQQIESEADDADLSISKYCEQVFQQHLQSEKDESQDWRYHTGERIEVVFDQLQRDITETLESVQADLDGDIENLQSLRTMYVVSLWELLKDDYGLPQQKAAMKAAGDRLDDSKDTESTTENASADHSDGAVSTD